MGGINFRTLLYFIASFAVVAVIYYALTKAVGSIVAAGIVIGLLVVLLLFTLWLTRTKRGNKVAEKIMLRLLKTRFGPRISSCSRSSKTYCWSFFQLSSRLATTCFMNASRSFSAGTAPSDSAAPSRVETSQAGGRRGTD